MNVKEFFAKHRRAGWILTGVLFVLMIAMLVMYIVSDGTYWLDSAEKDEDKADAKAAITEIVDVENV